MILLDALSIALAAFALYQVNELRRQTNARLTRLEARQPVKPETKTVERAEYLGGSKQDFPREIENFTPKKPETLRPNQVVGREVDDRSFEFDVKIKA